MKSENKPDFRTMLLSAAREYGQRAVVYPKLKMSAAQRNRHMDDMAQLVAYFSDRLMIAYGARPQFDLKRLLEAAKRELAMRETFRFLPDRDRKVAEMAAIAEHLQCEYDKTYPTLF